VDSGHYGTSALPGCWLLIDGLANGASLAVKPALAKQPNWGKFDLCTFKISKAQTNCEPGSISLQESDVYSDASPNVWHTFDTLTGVVTPLVSEIILERRPTKFVRTNGGSIADADCTDVDVTVCCQDLTSP
jgi:hypothetical protein